MCRWRGAAPCFLGPGNGSHGCFEAVSVRLGILPGLGLICHPLFFVSACLDGRCLPSLAVAAVLSGHIFGRLPSGYEGISTDFLGRSSVRNVIAGLGKLYPL